MICRDIKNDADGPVRKRTKKVAKAGGAAGGAQKLDELIAKQNKEYNKIRNELKAHTNQGDWVYILWMNNQAVPTSKSKVSFFLILNLAQCPIARKLNMKHQERECVVFTLIKNYFIENHPVLQKFHSSRGVDG